MRPEGQCMRRRSRGPLWHPTPGISHATMHGTSVAPSGLLPSDLNRPRGSLMLGTPAFTRARHMMSLIAKWRCDRPWDFIIILKELVYLPGLRPGELHVEEFCRSHADLTYSF